MKRYLLGGRRRVVGSTSGRRGLKWSAQGRAEAEDGWRENNSLHWTLWLNWLKEGEEEDEDDEEGEEFVVQLSCKTSKHSSLDEVCNWI